MTPKSIEPGAVILSGSRVAGASPEERAAVHRCMGDSGDTFEGDVVREMRAAAEAMRAHCLDLAERPGMTAEEIAKAIRALAAPDGA